MKFLERSHTHHLFLNGPKTLYYAKIDIKNISKEYHLSMIFNYRARRFKVLFNKLYSEDIRLFCKNIINSE